MVEIIPFFLVLFAGLFFSELFFRFHIPWVVALIGGGMLIGPSGLNVLMITPTLSFLAEIGLVFLMFMAGLEVSFRHNRQKHNIERLLYIALLSAALPFVVGLMIGASFGFTMIPSLLIAIAFVSTSIAVVVPALDSTHLLRSGLGRAIVSAAIMTDIASLVLLSIVLRTSQGGTLLGMVATYGLLLFAIIILRSLVPRVRWFFKSEVEHSEEHETFQQELRSIFVLLLGTVVIFELIGVHPIIAGFFTGIVLAETITSSILREKIRGIGYGLFIPIFFISVGAQTDISLLFNDVYTQTLSVVIVGGLVISKLVGGYLGARMAAFTDQESHIIGAAMIPKLSTTLAVVFASQQFGLLHDSVVTALVVTTLVSTLLSTLLIHWFARSYIREELEAHTNRLK
jgi:Kef-type K+ transport system membrane component KefB